MREDNMSAAWLLRMFGTVAVLTLLTSLHLHEIFYRGIDEATPKVCTTSDPLVNKLLRFRDDIIPHSFSDFMEGPGLDAPATSAAVCEFHMGKRTDHFPHTMQQIYPCWSYWRNHGGRKVLKLPRFFLKRPSKFLDGITKALEEVFDVEITTRNVGPAVSRQWVGPSFRMLHAEDASDLASGVRSYYNVNVQYNTDETSHWDYQSTPKQQTLHYKCEML